MGSIRSMRTVVIIQQDMPAYRLPFFAALSDALQRQGIDLRVLYGADDERNFPWWRKIRSTRVRLFGRNLVWQHAMAGIKDADLVIVEQASTRIINLYLQLSRIWSRRPLAFWGHGSNFQKSSGSPGNRIKALLARHVDWWFAYTELSAQAVAATGFPANRVTVVQNSADTVELNKSLRQLTDPDLLRLRASLGIRSSNVAVYCGSLYAAKKIEFMLGAAKRIRELIPDFEFIVIGSGPQSELVERAAAETDWLKFVGPRFGGDRVPPMKLAKIQLMPGVVGLALIDSFVLEVPLLTTRIDGHGPEIAYLADGANGMITEPDMEAFSRGAARALSEPELLETLRSGCRQAAEIYTQENMVERFSRGIVAALDKRAG